MKKSINPKRILFSLIYLLTPSILVLIFSLIGDISGYAFLWLFAISWFATILGIILFFKYQPCGFYALLLGLVLSPALMFIAEDFLFVDTEFGQSYYSMPLLIFYACPLAIISLVIFLVIFFLKRRKRKKT